MQKGSALSRDIFFWLGKDTTKDESGAAALLSVDLDDMFGGEPVQHREVQGHESGEFRQLFPCGIQYLQGGVDSMFNSVGPEQYEKRLLHVKGNRFVRVVAVPCAVGSLNSGDVFILDLGLELLQWNGSSSSSRERSKALDVVIDIRDTERGSRPTVEVLDEGDVASDAAKQFFSELGCGEPSQASIKTAEEGGADDSTHHASDVKFFDFTSGSASAVEERPLLKDMLKSDGLFVVVSGTDVWAWAGKSLSKDTRKGAMTSALSVVESEGLPGQTAVQVVKEGTESALSRQQFQQWHAVAVPKPAELKKAKRIKAEVDVNQMFAQGGDSGSTGQSLDLTQIQIDVWRVENFELVEWPKEKHGQFFAGDSYVVQAVSKDGKSNLIYFWQGRESSQDEKGASALQARTLDDKSGGNAVLCRVVQNKEPEHFCALFSGNMVVHSGGMPAGFKKTEGAESNEDDKVSAGPKLYHVKGLTAGVIRSVQVECKASSLNSGDCFVLTSEDSLYVWLGSGSSDEEKETAKATSGLLASRDAEAVAEGEEGDTFWELLGGKGEYAMVEEAAIDFGNPRLFQLCDAAVGGLGLKSEEIFNFSQDDLCIDDVMLLDAGTEVFLWIGTGASKNEKAEALGLAQKYIQHASNQSGRDCDVPILQVQPGHEPFNFTSNFVGWSSDKAQDFSDPYAAKLELVKAEKAKREAERDAEEAAKHAATAAKMEEAARAEEAAKAEAAAKEAAEESAAAAAATEDAEVPAVASGATFPCESLKGMGKSDGIDPTKKENYLDDVEFEKLFAMTRAAFGELKLWKQQDLKKKAGLY